MKAPTKAPKTYRLSQICIRQLLELKGNAYTETEIIEAAVNAYYQSQKSPLQRLHELLPKKGARVK